MGRKRHWTAAGFTIALAAIAIAASPGDAWAQTPLPCQRVLKADVVAIDQVYTYNRFGAYNPVGMMYALKRDVVPISGPTPGPGNARLRDTKRPRPLVLRMNVGDCLDVTFTNWLNPARPSPDAPATRTASMHVNGLQYNVQTSDGSWAGNNASSIVAPGSVANYRWYADKEGGYLVYSHGALAGGEGDGGSLVLGLFGAVNVEPPGSVWYRSQLTNRELNLVRQQVCTTTCVPVPCQIPTQGANDEAPPADETSPGPEIATVIIDDGGGEGGGGTCQSCTTRCKYVFNYDTAVDPAFGNIPVAKFLDPNNTIVHSDLNAIIDQRDPNVIAQDCAGTPASGTCGDFREFSVLFHDELKAVQAFPELNTPVFHGVRDGFGVNYGASGAGSIILANFKGVGPAATCAECKYEEFFLESWPNGDPALLPQYPDDPSNVHHSYLGDAVKIRNIHAGPKETHIFHLHAHQWLHEHEGKDSTYLDSQTIGPGSSFTYEINYGGSGNRNLTPGDAIFHCHLYPHFAQGMWELWRVHDVFEDGSASRSLPDKLLGTTPNPGILPMPAKALAPAPTATFPGYPFYIGAAWSPDGRGALAGRRSPTPPLDLEFDGGLPRHVVMTGAAFFVPGRQFDKHLDWAQFSFLPQNGTAAEVAAMNFHALPTHPSVDPNGNPATFFTNGRPAVSGAPFADPCDPNLQERTIDYRVAALELDLVVHQKPGGLLWKDPQGHIDVLNADVPQYIHQTRTADPFFFRANSRDCVNFHHTNLLPNVLEPDDFQIATPTDTIGQHIHLVKFDVTSSDGSGNGWNYEDGTFSPDEVRERINANNKCITLGLCPGAPTLAPQWNPWLPGTVAEAFGAQTTIQRWFADPLLGQNNPDRTIRTVFTHDHFGPSSIQHHGFYAGLVIEPQDPNAPPTQWWDPNPNGVGQLGVRWDGGPTLPQANILLQGSGDLDVPPDGITDHFREFNMAFADFAIVYEGARPVNPPPAPEAISAADVGTMLINYKTEPVPIRISQNYQGQVQAIGPRGNMANVFSSYVHGDPFTPLLQAYEKDRVKVRLIQGAQEEEHVFSMNALRWIHEPSEPRSGWYNAQALGISEHFEFVTPIPAACPATRRWEPWEVDEITVDALDELYPDGGVSLAQPAVAAAASAAVADKLDSESVPSYASDFSDRANEAVSRLSLDAGKVSTLTNTDGSTDSMYTAVSEFESPLVPADDGGEGGAAAAAPMMVMDTSYSVADSDGGGGVPGASSFTRSRRTRCFSDYMYSSTPDDDLWNGMWGILRAWRERRSDLRELPNNPRPTTGVSQALPRVTGRPGLPPNPGELDPCQGNDVFGNPKTVTAYRNIDLVAMNKALSYNPTVGINDPTGLLFVPAADETAVRNGTKPPEPLITRASGGQCLTVKLTNRMPFLVPDLAADDAIMPNIVNLNVDMMIPSRRVSLNPQLVDVNVRTSDGTAVGFNPDQTVRRNRSIRYRWYVPYDLRAPADPGSRLLPGPESLGGANLRDFGDIIKHGPQGLWGGVMLEPNGWTFSSNFYNSAVVTGPGGAPFFREFVLFSQDGLNLRDSGGNHIPDAPGAHPGEMDPEDQGSKAYNYKTEPFWGRLCPLTGGVCDFNAFNLQNVQQTDVLSSMVHGDPATPIFHAFPNDPIRFRLLQGDGRARQHAFTLNAHAWPHEPGLPNSMTIGTQGGHSVMRAFNVQPTYGAGGLTGTPGDYLYRDQGSFFFSGGKWGLLRVDPVDPCVIDPASCDPCVINPASCDPCAIGPCDPQPCPRGQLCYVY